MIRLKDGLVMSARELSVVFLLGVSVVQAEALLRFPPPTCRAPSPPRPERRNFIPRGYARRQVGPQTLGPRTNLDHGRPDIAAGWAFDLRSRRRTVTSPFGNRFRSGTGGENPARNVQPLRGRQAALSTRRYFVEGTPFWARESRPACTFNPEERMNARTTRGRARSGGFPVANNVVIKPMGVRPGGPGTIPGGWILLARPRPQPPKGGIAQRLGGRAGLTT